MWTCSETVVQIALLLRIIYHPNYNPLSFDYDFALIKLKNPVPFQDYPRIRPICLPPAGLPPNATEVSGHIKTSFIIVTLLTLI